MTEEVLPFQERCSDQQRLKQLRLSIKEQVNQAFNLAIRILLTENPTMPFTVAREHILEYWQDGTLNQGFEFNDLTDIEQALVDAWVELKELKDQLAQQAYNETDRDDILHVYGQPYWHQPIIIVGTVSALGKLAFTINESIRMGEANLDENFITNDGEGFKLTVIRENEDKIGKRKAPYYDVT